MKYIISTTFLIFTSLSILFSQQRLLILNRGEGQILSFKLANPNSPKILIGNSQETKVLRALDLIHYQEGGKLLWIDGSKKAIEAGDLEAKNPDLFNLDDSGIPVDLEIDQSNEVVFWVNQKQGKIYRSQLPNGGKTALNLALDDPTSIAINTKTNQLFCTELTKPLIKYSDLEGNNTGQFAIKYSRYPIRMVIDEENQKLYWSSDTGHSIGRSNMDGTDQEIIYRGTEEEHPFGLFINQRDQKLYWTDYGSDKVMRSNLDGTEAEEVIAGLKDPVAITILDVSEIQNLQHLVNLSSSSPSQQQISIFPNPARNKITIALSRADQKPEVVEIKIFNQLGELVRQFERTGSVQEIHTEDLPGGVYFCKVKMDSQEFHKQFVLIK